MTELDREAVHRALMKAGYAGDRDHVPQLPEDWEDDEDDGSAATEQAGMTRDRMDTSTHMGVEDMEATGGPGGTSAVIAVRFPDSGKLYYFDPVDLDPRVGDWVVVETPRGRDAAKVLVGRHQVVLNSNADPLKSVVRIVTVQELRRMEQLGNEATNALRICVEKVADARLPMKLIKAEYAFDASRITFYFTSESRVDFRQLVRELAAQFRTRIELRQVGARDEAKLLGGVGRCGLTLCCSTWLPDYPSTSIKQAKEQDLPLNPAKISGVCGRLLCCLSYEYDSYVALRRNLPRIGQRLGTPEGEGRVIAVQVLKQAVRVALDEGGTTEVEIGDPTDRQWQGEAMAAEPPPIPDRAAGDIAPETEMDAQRQRPGHDASRRAPAAGPMRGGTTDRRSGTTGGNRTGGRTARQGESPAAMGPAGTGATGGAVSETAAQPGPDAGQQPAADQSGEARRRRRRGRGRRKRGTQSSE
jgi:cell fate regulator YaaT (PSP1 superfamily)